MITNKFKLAGILVMIFAGSLASGFQLPNSYINMTEKELIASFQNEYDKGGAQGIRLFPVDKKLYNNPEFKADLGISTLDSGRRYKGYSIDRSKSQLVEEHLLNEDGAVLYVFGVRPVDPKITIQTPNCIDKGSFNDPHRDCNIKYGVSPYTFNIFSTFYVVVMNDGTEILLSSKLLNEVVFNYSVNGRNTTHRVTIRGKQVIINFVDRNEISMKVKSSTGELIGDMSFGVVN